jgi:hypothetical protein
MGILDQLTDGDALWNILETQHSSGAKSHGKAGKNMNRKFGVRVLVFFVLALCFACRPTTAQESHLPKLLLRVVNRHFTVGKRIPSDYLKVFSDGSVECHAIKFGEHDEDDVKKGQLSPDDLAKLTSALNDSGFQDLSDEYKLQRVVVDSWMEWDITIERSWLHSQNITLAFSGGNGDSKLPDALRKLGCQILDLRRRVYGDDGAYYNPACSGS